MNNKVGGFDLNTIIIAVITLIFGTGGALQTWAAAGDLDFSFGTQGRNMILIPNFTIPNALDWDPTEDIAIQPDGKILVAGSAWDSMLLMDFTVTRFNADGSLDTSFANDGVFRYHFNGDDHGYGIVLQPDGKIIIAGEAYLGVFNDQVDTAFGLIRLNPNGSIDSTFGTGGTVITNFFASLDQATEVALQPDGKIIATGWVTQGGVNTGSTYDFAVVRYNPNGSLDTTFGVGGKVTADFNGGGDIARTSVLQRDGKIVLGGYVTITPGSEYDFGLARFNSDGSLDTSFDGDGKVVTTFGNNLNELARGMALAPDNKLVVAGDFYNPPPVVGQSGHWDVAVARYNVDGSLDTAFDSDGRFVYDSNLTDRNEGAEDVLVQPDGKILFLGDSRLIVNAVPGVSDQDLQIGRLNVNGTLDSSFGNGGLTLTDWGIFDPPGAPNYGSGRTAEVMISAAIALQADGKIIAVNDSRRSTNSRRVAIARYQNDITSNVVRRSAFDFDGDGSADLSVFRPSDGIWYILQGGGGYASHRWGISTDKIMPGDYDGDGRTDLAVFRKSENSTWYVLNSSNNTYRAVAWGASNIEQPILFDTPVPADYDGDGKTDLAVWRLTDAIGEPARFLILQSSDNSARVQQWGNGSDRPAPADFDGDDRADLAVYRGGEWWWLASSNGQVRVANFGLGSDRPVAADYDGDGNADFAVYRNGTWYIQRGRAGFIAFNWGTATDTPVPADYDGDGKTDAAIFRDGVWWLLQSQMGVRTVQFGLAGDKPIPAAFIQ